MPSFKWSMYYRGDGKSSDFIKILPKKLTLQFPDQCWRKRKTSNQTIFKEVTTEGHHLNDEAREVLALRVEKSSYSKLYKAIKNAIYQNWNPTKTHFIGHSSGYDSRVISTAIEELHQQHGNTWYGNTIYVEVLEEYPEFEEIMERQGITNYYIYDPLTSYEFSDFFQKFNGVVGIAHNIYYDGYKYLEKEGYCSLENSQFFNGYGSNGIDDCLERGKSLRNYFRWVCQLQQQFLRTFTPDVVYPYWDYEVIRSKAGLPITEGERITRNLAKRVAPHLEDIPTLENTQQIIDRGQNRAHPFTKIKQWYDSSWYGKKNPYNHELRYYEYHPFWVHYTTASLCEYLRNRGYKIKRA